MSFSGTSLSGKSFHVVANPGEKILANISGENRSFNISGEVRATEYKATPNQPPRLNITFNTAIYNNNSFNQAVSTNQSIFQTYTIENILTLTNQQNISNESKTILQSHIKGFEGECEKSTPDHTKLKTILDSVLPIAKDVGLLLIKHALDKGIQLSFT